MGDLQSLPLPKEHINEDAVLTPRTNGLAEARNIDGRPIWESPILDYSDLIDTENGQSYTKRREAVLEYFAGDVAATTLIMDMYDESELLTDYIEWAKSNIEIAEDEKAKVFFETLRDDLRDDLFDLTGKENEKTGWVTFEQPEEGRWKMKEPEPWVYDDEDFDCLEGYEKVDDGEQFGSIIARIPDSHKTSTLEVARNFQVGLQPALKSAAAASLQSGQLALRILSLHTPKPDDDVD